MRPVSARRREDREMTEDLRIAVRFLAEPTLWGWEILDVADDSMVESSWSSHWTAFETREAAGADGRRRRAELLGDR
jgi:hypothetical protein